MGRSVPRLEDHRFLTGAATYADDLNVEGQAWGVVVRSPHAHAAIKSIDLSPALEMSDIIGVYTEADLADDGIGHLPCSAELPIEAGLYVPPRPALAREYVRYVGDQVAFVVAENQEAAAEAAEQVIIEYETLPAVVDGYAALEDGAPQIWEGAPGNLIFRFPKGDKAATEKAIEGAVHVVELDIVNNKISAVPMEPRSGIAQYDVSNETYTLMCSAQGLHGIRGPLAKTILKVPEEKLEIIAPDVGGGFGLKNFVYPEWVLLLWAARKLGRPVKWTGERGEEFAAATQGRGIRAQARLALDADGKFLALDAVMLADLGAYLSGASPGASTRAALTAMGGGYAVPKIYTESRGVFTNTAPVDAYRGAGKPEANYITERLIEAAARRLGFDPVELRRKNAVVDFPYDTAQGLTFDCGRFGPNIDDIVELIDRDGFVARRAESKANGKLRGLGIGCFLETSRGAPQEGAEVIFAADGKIELRVGTESNGQGHETSYKQIAADRFDLTMDEFRYVQADTREIRIGFGHGGARSMHMGGGAMMQAIDGVLEKAKPIAARLLQTDPEDLAYSNGAFSVAASGQSMSLVDLVKEVGDGRLDTFVFNEDVPFTFPNGCQAAEVEIDLETGEVALIRYIVVDDYGNLINPMLTIGQVQGGLTQGIGQALGEICTYQVESGQLLAGSMMDYWLPRASQLPDFEIHLKEDTPTTANPLGVKGSGQAGCIGAPQTIVHAVLDALAPLGVDDIDMPMTSEIVWRTIRDARN
ncbi:MAG: xanthine dehydrogenase family protein molybdopterin-binding subunit [Pseudomonadota bacterium]|nr:xanthine dehydrogenase family protein molybdopterin-binding subunit [Pseudomonadota bacterium]